MDVFFAQLKHQNVKQQEAYQTTQLLGLQLLYLTHARTTILSKDVIFNLKLGVFVICIFYCTLIFKSTHILRITAQKNYRSVRLKSPLLLMHNSQIAVRRPPRSVPLATDSVANRKRKYAEDYNK